MRTLSSNEMKPLALAMLTFLAGCATIDTRWDTCQKAGATFVQVAECTVQGVDADASRWAQPTLRMRSEARAKRFAIKADDLMEKVATGRLHDADARVELRRALDELQDEERDDRLSPIRQPQKSGMTCSPVGTSVSCTPN
jgi:hypothetical protein